MIRPLDWRLQCPFVTWSRQLSGSRMFQEVMYKPVNGIVIWISLSWIRIYSERITLLCGTIPKLHIELEVDLLFPMMNPHFIPVVICYRIKLLLLIRLTGIWSFEIRKTVDRPRSTSWVVIDVDFSHLYCTSKIFSGVALERYWIKFPL